MHSFKITALLVSLLTASAIAAPTADSRRARSNVSSRQAGGACENVLINFDDDEFATVGSEDLLPVPDGFKGFNWPDFSVATCPGRACKSFPAETTRQFTGPRLAMAQGLVGGLLTGQLLLETSPSAEFNLQNAGGSFDLGNFDVFDIIDLPEQVKAGAKEDMRVHLDCTKAGSSDRVKRTIPFDRNKDSAGYSVIDLGEEFTGLSGCKISTTQVFFPGKLFELEIPTESMGLDNLNVCVR